MADNYRALTRTYRPTSFDDIVSQQHVSDTLKNAIKQNRLAHAYMFCGPRGVGKTTMARVLARTLNEIDEEVSGESLTQTLNIIEIDAASNNGVDDIRDLRERVRIPPQNGRFKIYIIDEVHMLSKSAFNALLKTLEEPPDHVIFIFATTEPHKVLPTILSRVQRFDFKRISVDEIVERLRKVAGDENISIDDESLHVIAKKADGALRDALGLMDQAIAFCGDNIQHEELLRALNVVSTERMFDFMQAVEQHDANQGLELIHSLLQEGYDIQEYLVGLTEHLRNLYVAKSSEKMYLIEASPETKKRYKKASEAFSEDDLMRMLHIVSEAQYKIKEAHQPKIQFEITLLKLIHMERTQKLNKLLGELEQLKKKFSNQPGLKLTKEAQSQAASVTKNGNEPEPDQPSENEIASQFKNGLENGSPEAKPSSTSENEVTEEVAVEEPDSGDEFTQLFGQSSLNKKPAANGSAPKMEAAVRAENTSPKRAPKDVSLNEIKECWDDYIEELRQEVQQMLYFQMQRVDPIKLKNGDLLLRCNDEFAKKTVEENKRRLGKILEHKIDAFLHFNCVVQKDESTVEESKSPYERFKDLQERDPTIKKLVELFGAELDYNLNR
ncbi:MAG TPA: DNA polymerase III subunit gamma/tau [Balneolaceae bacterium]